ncbi:hypothetical protein [Microbacterium sp. 179-I 3D3 NHS]|uniref:hypothetical protein n=1 Tax=Microbacterium sp. 179-I 3D3 NHS TaxID=3142382 RepID=UPI0039A2E4A5
MPSPNSHPTARPSTFARYGRRTVASAAVTAAIIVGSLLAGPSANADESSDGVTEQEVTAEGVADLINAVAPTTVLAAPGDVANGSLNTVAGDTESQIPLDATEPILVESTPNNETLSASIRLPDEMPIGAGTVTSDGTVVYPATDGSGDAVAVQNLEDGSTRIQTVIADSSSPHEFGYRMDGYQPFMSDTGEVIFLDSSDNYVPIAAPWAVDATGAPVQTTYTIRGDELVQVVTPDASTVYPVVADPSWMWQGPAWGMKLNRSETSRVRDYAAAVGMCVIFSKSVSIGCAAFGSYIQVQANIAEGDKPKTCLFFTALPVPGVIWRVPC